MGFAASPTGRTLAADLTPYAQETTVARVQRVIRDQPGPDAESGAIAGFRRGAARLLNEAFDLGVNAVHRSPISFGV